MHERWFHPGSTAALIFLAFIMVILFGRGTARADDAVTIKAQPAQIVRRTFDPSRPPAEMPKLSGNEAAITRGEFGAISQIRVGFTSQNAVSVKVEAIEIMTSLKVTVWVPVGANQHLRDHEETHRKINELYYEDAAAIAEKLARPYIGKTLTGEGATPAAARQAAIDRVTQSIGKAWLAAIQQPAGRVNDLFDEISDHGRKKIAAEEAMKQAQKRYEEEQK